MLWCRLCSEHGCQCRYNDGIGMAFCTVVVVAWDSVLLRGVIESSVMIQHCFYIIVQGFC